VIDEKSFDNIKRYIDNAKKDSKAEIWVGGKCDKSQGYFVQPTIIEAKDPKYVTMCEEIFGPYLLYIYTMLTSLSGHWILLIQLHPMR
jgi:1-pyrroline-5-carboxylate dehydrogenase